VLNNWLTTIKFSQLIYLFLPLCRTVEMGVFKTCLINITDSTMLALNNCKGCSLQTPVFSHWLYSQCYFFNPSFCVLQISRAVVRHQRSNSMATTWLALSHNIFVKYDTRLMMNWSFAMFCLLCASCSPEFSWNKIHEIRSPAGDTMNFPSSFF